MTPHSEKYQRQAKKQDYLKIVSELYPDTTLLTLWQKYLEYKIPMLKESTIAYLGTSITRHLEKSQLESPYKALELRQFLLDSTTESMAKRVLIYVSAAFKWGIKHKLVKAPNPYEGMNADLKHAYEKETKPNAFTLCEKQALINAFESHQGNWNGKGYVGFAYSYYAGFVKFLFLTGCRPSEAVGLQWGNVSADCRKIIFDGGIYNNGTKMFRTKGSKTNNKREFPCNAELQALLKSIRPINPSNDDLVFPSPKGKAINYNNFLKKAWAVIANSVKPGTTPYNCRDTFITEQIAKGVPTAITAKWVDTSVAMIEKHYLDNQALTYILPQ